MRIAAGGLLLLGSLFNLIVALGFLRGGAFAIQLGGVLGGGAESFSTADSEIIQSLGGPTTLGWALVVSSVVIVFGAVSVLRSRSHVTIYGGCSIAILASILQVSLTNIGLTSIVGIVGGGLGFISGLRIQLTAAESADDDATPASKPRDVGEWIAVGLIVLGLVLVMLAAYLWIR